MAKGRANRPALLLRFKTPIAAATLPAPDQRDHLMQAAAPAVGPRADEPRGRGRRSAARIRLRNDGDGRRLSMFAALMSALHERRYDLALMRSSGRGPATVFALLACEGVTLVVAGVILGLALGHAATEALGSLDRALQAVVDHRPRLGPQEPGSRWRCSQRAMLTCVLPAIQAYRRDPAILLKRKTMQAAHIRNRLSRRSPSPLGAARATGPEGPAGARRRARGAPAGTVPWELLQQAKTVQKADKKFGPVNSRARSAASTRSR